MIDMSNKPKRTFGQRYVAFAENVSEISGHIAAYLLIPVLIVFVIEIIARNVFNSPTVWAYGMCYILGGIAAVLGFGYAMKKGAMVRIDALYGKLKRKTQLILDLILYTLLFLPLTIGGSYVSAVKAIASVASGELISTGSWNAPIWPTKIAIVVALVILAMQGIAEMVRDVWELKAMGEEGGHK